MKRLTDYEREIVKEIHAQLLGMGQIKVMSWGASNWVGLTIGKNPTLQFTVQGCLFQGHVRIEYMLGRDHYDIHFGKLSKKTLEWKNVKTLKGIYFNEMTDLIDQYVEFIPVDKARTG